MLDLIDNSFPQDEKSGKKKKKQKLAKELSRCVNYVSSVGFKGFEHAKQNSKHFRAIFNWVSKIIWDCTGFCFTSFRDWSRKLAPLSLNQSDAKLKTNTNWSPAFSRAFGILLGFSWSSHWFFKFFHFVWLVVVTTLVLVLRHSYHGQSDYLPSGREDRLTCVFGKVWEFSQHGETLTMKGSEKRRRHGFEFCHSLKFFKLFLKFLLLDHFFTCTWIFPCPTFIT